MTAEEYRAKVLKTILEYESHFNAVDDYEVKDAIAYLYEIIRGIDAIPSTERTEIVRCKDCKSYDGKPCGLVNFYNTDNDYCSRYEGKG